MTYKYPPSSVRFASTFPLERGKALYKEKADAWKSITSAFGHKTVVCFSEDYLQQQSLEPPQQHESNKYQSSMSEQSQPFLS